MKVDKSKWERKRLKIKFLKPHPDQDLLYGGTTTPAQDAAFARDLSERSQLERIQVMPFPNAAGLPKCTVIDGWRRTSAAKANGRTGIDCYVRNDLADATAAEIAVEFAKFNASRRQLSRLALARNIHYQIQHRRGRSGRLDWPDREKVKKEIGEQFGLDLRSINRYLLVLETPIETQRAFDRGEVTLVNAGKVANLPKQLKTQIAERIAAGENAKEVVHEYIEGGNGRHKRAIDGFVNFTVSLERALADIGDRADEIYPGKIKEKLPVLKRGMAFIAKLMAEGRKKVQTTDDMLEQLKKKSQGTE